MDRPGGREEGSEPDLRLRPATGVGLPSPFFLPVDSFESGSFSGVEFCDEV